MGITVLLVISRDAEDFLWVTEQFEILGILPEREVGGILASGLVSRLTSGLVGTVSSKVGRQYRPIEILVFFNTHNHKLIITTLHFLLYGL